MSLIVKLREGEEVIIRVGETEIVVFLDEVWSHSQAKIGFKVSKSVAIVRDDVDFGSKRRGGIDSGWAVD